MPDSARSQSRAVVTVGTFDGVHLGHRDIIRRLRGRAVGSNARAVLVTFRPHPLEIVNPSAAPMLLTPDAEQLDALGAEPGVDVHVLPFTAELAHYTAEEFVLQVLVAQFAMGELVIGYDHGLGRGRQGDAAMLTRLGTMHGFAVDIVPATLDGHGVPISSSAIRTSIAHGDLERARASLGRPYSLKGTVARGSQRGRDLGYPTLNIAIPPRKLLPPDGVYAVRGRSVRGTFGGMMNLGGRPTFGDHERAVEVHLFDVSGDWYGETVSVDLIRRLRDTTRFAGVDALVAQLAKDAESARLALTQA